MRRRVRDARSRAGAHARTVARKCVVRRAARTRRRVRGQPAFGARAFGGVPRERRDRFHVGDGCGRMRRAPRPGRAQRLWFYAGRRRRERGRGMGGFAPGRPDGVSAASRASQGSNAGAASARGIRAPRDLAPGSISRSARRRPSARRRDRRARRFRYPRHRRRHARSARRGARNGSGVGRFQRRRVLAGLRPATPGGRPFIGRTPLEGLYVAAGHYRNGILLAPATARLLCAAIEGSEMETALHGAKDAS